MGWEKNTLRQGLASQLLILGSIPLQRDLWEGKISGYISYYSECLNYLEDYGVPDNLDFFIREGFVSELEAKKLRSLNYLLDKTIEFFTDKEPTNKEVWDSKVWNDFSAASMTVLRTFFVSDLAEAGQPQLGWLSKYGN